MFNLGSVDVSCYTSDILEYSSDENYGFLVIRQADNWKKCRAPILDLAQDLSLYITIEVPNIGK